jgi:hypothetical protein
MEGLTYNFWEESECNGAPDRIRTCGLRLRRPTLYPAELRAREHRFYLRTVVTHVSGMTCYPCVRNAGTPAFAALPLRRDTLGMACQPKLTLSWQA